VSHDAGDADFSAEDWALYLSSELGRNVRVRFGRARRQVLVAFPERHGLRVRMNRVFCRAPDPVRAAVVSWLRAGPRARGACRELDHWIASIVTSLGPPRAPRLRTGGQHHDLEPIAAELLEHEFAHLTPAQRPLGLTWGRRGPRGARRSLQLGSYDPETRIVRVHPVLDQPAVPAWFVRYVLFHEFLHAALDERCTGEKRVRHHGPEFRRLERAYAGTQPALAWQEQHLTALIRSARTGRPLPLPRPKPVRRLLQRLLFE